MSSGHETEEKTSIVEKVLLLVMAIAVMFIVSLIVGAIASPFNMAPPAHHEGEEAVHHDADEDSHEETAVPGVERVVIPGGGQATAGGPAEETAEPREDTPGESPDGGVGEPE